MTTRSGEHREVTGEEEDIFCWSKRRNKNGSEDTEMATRDEEKTPVDAAEGKASIRRS